MDEVTDEEVLNVLAGDKKQYASMEDILAVLEHISVNLRAIYNS